MELVIALSIIFSIMALSTAIYTAEELMKLRDILDVLRIEVDCYSKQTERVLDLAQSVLNNNDKMIKYIDALEDRTKKED